MKQALPISVALLAAQALHAVTPVDSTIIAATVYGDRAVVTRSAEIDAKAGEQQFVFQNLPTSILADSIQVSGRGTAQVTILEVTTSLQYAQSGTNEAVQALEAEVKNLQKERRIITDRSTTLDQQQTLLTQIAGWGASVKSSNKDSPTPPPMNIAGWQQLIEFYTAGLEKIASEKRSLDERREEIDGKIEALNAQIGQSQAGASTAVENVTVRASAANAGRLALTLSYAVTDASWNPSYDARLSSPDKTLTLGYFGIVRQRTGEDWKSVGLTLSTARPSVGGSTPKLQPWVLAQMEPFTVSADLNSGYAATSTLAGTRIPAYMKKMETGDKAGSFVSRNELAAMTAAATSATFRIPGLSDIPSDNAAHRVGVTTAQLKADLAYDTSPKLLPAAFLDAKARNDSGYPFLPGPVSSFLDGTFVASGWFRPVMPGEKLDLPFGVDDGIVVERKLVNRFTEDFGLVTSQVRITYDILITVTNNRTSAAAITVTDQIPVSRHEKIKVAQLEPDPGANKPNSDGILTWSLNLKPGEKQELPLKFTIEYPKDLPVAGLE